MIELDFSKLDRVELSMADVDKIRGWYDFHYDTLKASGEINFPFEEGLIVVKDDTLREYISRLPEGVEIPYNEVVLYFNVKGQFDITFNLYIQESGKPDLNPTLSWKLDETFLETHKFEWSTSFKHKKELLTDEIAQGQAKFQTMLAFEVFAYMCNVTENIIETKVTKTVTKKGKFKKGAKSKKKIVKISVTKYTIDSSEETGRKNERHALAWTVRGHWRYYKKTGKRVWIKPHVKGEGNTADGKIYKI